MEEPVMSEEPAPVEAMEELHLLEKPEGPELLEVQEKPVRMEPETVNANPGILTDDDLDRLLEDVKIVEGDSSIKTEDLEELTSSALDLSSIEKDLKGLVVKDTVEKGKHSGVIIDDFKDFDLELDLANLENKMRAINPEQQSQEKEDLELDLDLDLDPDKLVIDIDKLKFKKDTPGESE
jgi:hypothetical protein